MDLMKSTPATPQLGQCQAIPEEWRLPIDGAAMLEALKRCTTLQEALAMGRSIGKAAGVGKESKSSVNDVQNVIGRLRLRIAGTLGDPDVGTRLLNAINDYESIKAQFLQRLNPRCPAMTEEEAIVQVAKQCDFSGRGWGGAPVQHLPDSSWPSPTGAAKAFCASRTGDQLAGMTDPIGVRTASFSPLGNSECESAGVNEQKGIAPETNASGLDQARYLDVMASSMRISRTINPAAMKLEEGARKSRRSSHEGLATKAAKSYLRAARMIINHHDEMPLNYKTARFLNWLVNRNACSGDPMAWAAFRKTMRFCAKHGNMSMYSWLESSAAKELAQRDPVGFAERIHHNGNYGDRVYENFPDGNGRTWRLMADLALIQAGLTPVMYTRMDTYFAAGSARTVGPRDVSRRQLEHYFRDCAARGQAYVDSAAAESVL